VQYNPLASGGTSGGSKALHLRFLLIKLLAPLLVLSPTRQGLYNRYIYLCAADNSLPGASVTLLVITPQLFGRIKKAWWSGFPSWEGQRCVSPCAYRPCMTNNALRLLHGVEHTPATTQFTAPPLERGIKKNLPNSVGDNTNKGGYNSPRV